MDLKGAWDCIDAGPLTNEARYDGSRRPQYLFLWRGGLERLVFSAEKQKETIDRILMEAQVPDEGQVIVRSLLQDMIERKKVHFATNSRVILDYILKDTGNGLDLSVIALQPKSPASYGTIRLRSGRFVLNG